MRRLATVMLSSFVIITALTSLLAVVTTIYADPLPGYVPHDPILIDGDDGFTLANGTTGGSGTEQDPYIIEGWDISVGSSYGIRIFNTDAYFVVRNVSVHDGLSGSSGLWLNHSSHGTIRDSIVKNFGISGIGMSIINSNSTVVRNNSIDNATLGVWLYSNRCMLINNTINNTAYGITLDLSNNTVTQNILTNASSAGIYLYSSDDNNVSLNSVSNCQEGISLKRDCLRNLVLDNEIHNGFAAGWSVGINVYFSPDTRVLGNNMSNLSMGILIDYSARANVTGNVCRNMTDNSFVQLSYSDDGLVSWNEATDCWRGVTVYTSSSCRIVSNSISGCYYGVTSEFSSSTNYSSNIIAGARDRAITLEHSDDNELWNNLVSDCGADAVTVWASSRVSLNRNTIEDSVGWGVRSYESTELVLRANTLTSDGVVLMGSSVDVFASHSISADNLVNSKPLQYFADSEDIMIDGSNVGQLLLANCTDVSVANLSIGNSDLGIEVAFCANVTVKGCNLSHQMKGLYAVYDQLLSVEMGHFNWDSSGMEIFYSGYVTVRNCTMHDDANVALWLEECDNSTILGNRLWDDAVGLYMWDCDNVSVTMNRFQQSGVGAWIDSSSSFIVYRNDFISCSATAWNSISSWWNNTYPIAGNYWSSYAGSDHHSGPNQDGPQPDGIGDDPYVISSQVTDYYPLMGPATAVDAPPTASFSVSPSTGDTMTFFVLDASNSTDAEDPGVVLEARWDFDGDGSWDTDWTTEKSVQHQFATPGTYDVIVEVRDSSGLTDTETVQLTVTEYIPEFDGIWIPLLVAILAVVILGISRRRSK